MPAASAAPVCATCIQGERTALWVLSYMSFTLHPVSAGWPRPGASRVGGSASYTDLLAALGDPGRLGVRGQDPGVHVQVVDAVLYLETVGFVTGESLYVDGGQSAGH